MSLDMVGESILILLDCKSGNIERLLLRFYDENQKRKFCGDVLTSAQNQIFCHITECCGERGSVVELSQAAKA